MQQSRLKTALGIKLSDFNVRGTFTQDAPLGEKSWFRCGGAADLLFEPADQHDLAHFLHQYPAKAPLNILGGMANCIIRDGGVRGCTIRLGKPFSYIDISSCHYLQVGAGALNGSVASAAVKAGIGGLEFLSGIPGTVGGALRMNAGAYGSEIKDILVGVYAMDISGKIHRLSLQDIEMSYRHTRLPDESMILISAIFKGQNEPYETVKARINDIKAKRNETQPIKEKTGGSTFANPSPEELHRAGLPKGTRAWQVVEKVGGRGLAIGGAQMSEKHCNFMINTGNATAADLENLGDELIARAKTNLRISLNWEIRCIGEKV